MKRTDPPVSGPDVTVIMPAYNAGKTLERAARSALRQEDVAVEVIIVNDCSQDDTGEVADALQQDDHRVRVIHRPVNGGVSLARNDALSASRGTWVTPLDSDDSFEPGRLAALISAAEKWDADLLADNINRCNSESEKQGVMFENQATRGAEISVAEFVRSYSPGSVSFGYIKALIRRDFLEAHSLRYAEDIECAEDWFFYLSCMLRGGKLVFIPAAYYNYVIHPQSHSRQRARMVANARHELLAQEKARQLSLQYGHTAVAEQIQAQLPHYRRLLRKQRIKRFLFDLPFVEALVDWRKARQRPT